MKPILGERNNTILMLLFVLLSACMHDPQFPILDYTELAVGNVIIDTTENGIETSVTCNPDIMYFEKDVLPILLSSCAYSGCHDSRSRQEGVILTNYTTTMRTGGIKPYNPGKSAIYESLTAFGERKMPPSPNKPLSQSDKDILRDWIGQGAEDFYCDACNPEKYNFAGEIKPIIETYCIRCHNTSRTEGNVSLITYSDIKKSADKGALLGTIKHLNGYSQMPQAGSLPDCEIAQIESWIISAMPNN